MHKHADIQKIIDILEKLYPETPIPLDFKNHFTFLVAVMLSAQTTDKKVNEVTPALFAKADSAEKMALLDESEILGIIRPLGLAPTKAKNVKRMSQLLVERHQGVVPADADALEDLPGVGHKTASVILSQAFGIPTFPVDTHIHRLAHRWGLSDGSSVVQTERDLKGIFDRGLWSKLHLQIIFFGREYCPARGHIVGSCQICSWISGGGI